MPHQNLLLTQSINKKTSKFHFYFKITITNKSQQPQKVDHFKNWHSIMKMNWLFIKTKKQVHTLSIYSEKLSSKNFNKNRSSILKWQVKFRQHCQVCFMKLKIFRYKILRIMEVFLRGICTHQQKFKTLISPCNKNNSIGVRQRIFKNPKLYRRLGIYVISRNIISIQHRYKLLK